jgi:hypothetical protein
VAEARLSQDLEKRMIFIIFIHHPSTTQPTSPNKSPEPTAVGACSSAIAVHVTSRRWLSYIGR